MDEAGMVLARRRLPESAAGIALLHGLVGGCLGVEQDPDEAQVLTDIETGRSPWAAALVAAGYVVSPVNPLQSARFRARHHVSGARSDAGDAHVLADMVRTDARQPRQAAGDSPAALDAFGGDLDAPEALELLAKFPEPPRAVRLTRAQVSAALKRARRRTSPAGSPRSWVRCAATNSASRRPSSWHTRPPSGLGTDVKQFTELDRARPRCPDRPGGR